MTVRCIGDLQKQAIAFQYRDLRVPVEQIAKEYRVSKRTINRVLVEEGANKVRFHKRKDQRVLPTQQDLWLDLPIEFVPQVTFFQKVKLFFQRLFFNSNHVHATTRKH